MNELKMTLAYLRLGGPHILDLYTVQSSAFIGVHNIHLTLFWKAICKEPQQNANIMIPKIWADFLYRMIRTIVRSLLARYTSVFCILIQANQANDSSLLQDTCNWIQKANAWIKIRVSEYWTLSPGRENINQ